jgi:hypothetical protein
MQQMSGGIGAVVAGLIVSQANESAPLEHYDTLGYAVVGVIFISAVLVYRVSKLVSK